MSELLWSAFIGSSSAVLGVLLGQIWTSKTVSAQLRHAEQQEDLKWRREETRRLAELRDQRLRELWNCALEVRVRTIDLLLIGRQADESPLPKARDGVFEAAARAYSVALTGLPELRDVAKRFYEASASLESRAGHNSDSDARMELTRNWTRSFFELEAAVARVADQQFSLVDPKSEMGR
ncbi:hypothetical protein ACVC7V_17450 [Hydrogenophaga sp. A37]|uniref:hypothetical protein n=1 Tax=Hydrogenophaga sp. A37 TaxID=1945864 RepID=UPI00117A7132|nr:hypothetical protein [Hydrogenophaga sp. A37]